MSFLVSGSRLMQRLLSDDELEARFSDTAEIEAVIAFEIALAKAQVELGMVKENQFLAIRETLQDCKLDLEALRGDVERDGMIVPGLVKQLRTALPDDVAPALHFKSTSQDVIDTTAMMRIRACHAVLVDRLDALTKSLAKVRQEHGNREFMAYTRMQAALPSTAGERLDNWLFPLEALAKAELVFPVQLSGPIGSSQAYDGRRDKLATLMAADLSLDNLGRSWQTDRSIIMDIAHWHTKLTGHLGKIGQDICLMAQMGADQISLSSGGGSSAMAHKKNPVLAEALVAIGRYNATQISGLHQAVFHEQERSGAAWMLEWMILPNVIIAAGTALNHANRLVASIETIGKS